MVAIIPDIIPPTAFLVLADLSERMFLVHFNREHQQTIKPQKYKVFLLDEFLEITKLIQKKSNTNSISF